MHNPFTSFGAFLKAVRMAAVVPGPLDPRLETRAAAGSSEAAPSDGGFLMQPDFVRPLIERIYLTGAILSRCTEFPISNQGDGVIFPTFDESSRQNGSRMGGLEAYWAAEASAATASKPRFARGETRASKIIGLCYLTDEIFKDAAALEVFVSMGLSKEISFRIEDALINGDGLDKPLGIMNGGGLITVPKQSGQAAGTLIGQNIIDVWARCWAPSRRTAVWLAHTDAEAQCIGATAAVGTGGAPIQLYKAAEDENQPYNFMLGRPVIPMEQMQVPGTPGDLVLVDWSRYLVAAREFRTDVSMHIRFLTDENAFRVVMRIGGQPIDGRPLVPFNGTNTVSPYVCIAQR